MTDAMNYGALIDYLHEREGLGYPDARNVAKAAALHGECEFGDIIVSCTGTWYTVAERPQLQCCGIWTDYPTPGRDTQCPECKSTFHVS